MNTGRIIWYQGIVIDWFFSLDDGILIIGAIKSLFLLDIHTEVFTDKSMMSEICF